MRKISRNYFTFPYYVPRIFSLLRNWPEYLVRYLSRSRLPTEYRMRNGVRLKDDGSATLSGTIAVVFIRREYGVPERFRTIVDIGANVGSFAVFAAQACPDAKVYCYEPEERTFGLLKQNIGLNRLEGRVSALRSAVASIAGKRSLAVGSSSLDSSFHIIPAAPRLQPVSCTTLKDILANEELDRIDLLKINCEGAEYEILEGCSPGDFDRIANIRLEYHNLDAPTRNGEALSRFLEARGYHIERFTRYLNRSGFIWASRGIANSAFFASLLSAA